MSGKFVVIYGANNLGKTTACINLVNLLKKDGVKAEYLKYPVYKIKPTGKKLDDYLRNGNPEKLTVLEAQKLFAQNRRDYENKLLEKLNKGTVVIAEDYVGTGIAWGLVSGLDILALEEINENLLKPDLSIMLDGKRFLTKIEKTHINEVDGKRWQKARKIHKKLAKRYNWILVNANDSKEKVAQSLHIIVKKLLKK